MFLLDLLGGWGTCEYGGPLLFVSWYLVHSWNLSVPMAIINCTCSTSVFMESSTTFSASIYSFNSCSTLLPISNLMWLHSPYPIFVRRTRNLCMVSILYSYLLSWNKLASPVALTLHGFETGLQSLPLLISHPPPLRLGITLSLPSSPAFLLPSWSVIRANVRPPRYSKLSACTICQNAEVGKEKGSILPHCSICHPFVTSCHVLSHPGFCGLQWTLVDSGVGIAPHTSPY